VSKDEQGAQNTIEFIVVLKTTIVFHETQRNEIFTVSIVLCFMVASLWHFSVAEWTYHGTAG
jgi:hypothetical protein